MTQPTAVRTTPEPKLILRKLPFLISKVGTFLKINWTTQSKLSGIGSTFAGLLSRD
jgi:hypothetical protein